MQKPAVVVSHLFTGPDGKTHDPARWLWIIGIIAFLAFAGYELYRSGRFDMTNFGIAYATLLGGGAAGVKIKESTEPRASLAEDVGDRPDPAPQFFAPSRAPAYTPTPYSPAKFADPMIAHPTMAPVTYDPSKPPE
jgi:hypothetical protein